MKKHNTPPPGNTSSTSISSGDMIDVTPLLDAAGCVSTLVERVLVQRDHFDVCVAHLDAEPPRPGQTHEARLWWTLVFAALAKQTGSVPVVLVPAPPTA